MSFLIDRVAAGPGWPCRLVAEVSNNHNGSLVRAKRLIAAAQRAGADVVKLQAYTPAELVALRGDGPAPEPWGAQGYTMRTLYERAQTPLEWLPDLFAYARHLGMPIFSSVFGPESLAALEAVGCAAYKVSHLDFQHADLVAMVAATRKPMLVSVPRGFGEREQDVLFRLAPDAELLYCPGGYPCADVDLLLPQFVETPYLGLSLHSLAPQAPVAAVARGAKLIEAHFMLGLEPGALEASVSMTEWTFAAMVNNVRLAERMLDD